jgi:hypothetical protein
MKSIIIEVVNNGWLVRGFNGNSFDSRNAVGELFVFSNIKDLQKQLPELLDYGIIPEVTDDQKVF